MKTVAEVVKEAREKGVAETAAYKASLAGTASTQTNEPKDKLTFKAVKVDDQGVLTLCASSIAVDGADETVQKGDMIAMAYDFCAAKDRVFKGNHDDEVKIEAQLVESCIGVPVLKSGKVLEPGQDVPSDDPFDHVRTMDAEKGANTHWFISVRPTDPEIVKAAKEGKIVGASWGGTCLRVEE